MNNIPKIVNQAPCNPVIFSLTENEWSEPRKCTGGCGHSITFNDAIVGRDGETIPHLQPHKQHYCPTLYRNFGRLSLIIQEENKAK